MNAIEALSARTSIRAFTSEAVTEQDLMEIFEAAQRTPSWANSQPWEAFVATGESALRIKEAIDKKFQSGAKAEPEIQRPQEWPESAKARQRQIGADMERDCGDDKEHFGELNRALFNAPAFIFVCMDKIYSEWGMYDVGAYTQSVMIAAVEKGLSTIPAINIVLYPDVIREELKIPENLKIVIGIAIGHKDVSNGINKLRTSRSPLSETVHIKA